MKHHAKFDKNWISNEADISKNTKYKYLLQESPSMHQTKPPNAWLLQLTQV